MENDMKKKVANVERESGYSWGSQHPRSIKCTKAWFAYYVQPNIQTLIRLKLGADKLGLEVQSNSQIKSSYSLI